VTVYLDNCIVIYQTEESEPSAARIGDALANLTARDVVISDLVRLECLVLPLRKADLSLVGRFHIAFSALTIAAIDPGVYDRAAEIRPRHRIKTPDALHLAAAIEHGCHEFWTNDDRLAAVRGEIKMRVFA
jgi:predicted nucleic acid-binding protein